MEMLCDILKARRAELSLGVRELCRKTEGKDYIAEEISATYYSRLERGGAGYCVMDKVSIDKLWTLGVVLLICPTALFLSSRGLDESFLRIWSVTESSEVAFGLFLRRRRQDLTLSLRQACALTEKTPFPVSMGFWSQFETDFRGQSSKISGDKLMGVALALNVDPLLLYVLSRKLPARYLNEKTRRSLFH